MNRNRSLLLELWEFVRFRKRYWLIPILLILLLFGLLVVATESSAVASLIYTLF